MTVCTASDVALRYKLPERLRSVEYALHESGLPPHQVFASHRGNPIRWPLTKYRAQLDEFFGGFSALHLGCLDSAETLGSIGLDPKRVLSILSQPDIRRYYADYYPYAPPFLVSASLTTGLPEPYLEASAGECADERWQCEYQRFLCLDARFVADGPLGDFLSLLDDYLVHGFSRADLRQALAEPRLLKEWLEDDDRRALVEGMQDFFEFSEDLHLHLSSLDDFPLHRGLIWLHFAYWYGNGGERMRRVAAWVKDALNLMPAEQSGDEAAAASRLEDVMSDLTDPNRFADFAIKSAGDCLGEWRANALGAMTR